MNSNKKSFLRNLQPLSLISGHYGSGKTEFAVNLAIQSAQSGETTTLVDLDIVNPYFRSFERRQELEAVGVKLVVSSVGGLADLPALPAEVTAILRRGSGRNLVDLGGDPEGARVLGYYEKALAEVDKDFILVLNANRPETSSPAKAKSYLEKIEFMSRQKVTALINNTHLCRETEAGDILRGEELALAVAADCGLPLLCSVVERRLLDEVKEGLKAEAFVIDIYMRKPWESSDDEWGGFTQPT